MARWHDLHCLLILNKIEAQKITLFLLEPTTDVHVNESGPDICIRKVKFQHVIDHNTFIALRVS